MTAELVRILNERAGCGLELTGVIDQGQSGAAYVRRPDGRDAVVTTALASPARMRATAEVLARLRARGYPVPEHQFLLPVDDGTVAVVQERLPGSTPALATVQTVRAIVALNERFAGLLADRPDIPAPPLALGRDGDPIPGGPLQEHSPRTRRMLRRIRAVADEHDGQVTGDDLVHVDLTVPNTLFLDDGRIGGLIDWNYGVARGDRRFGLVKLLHTLSFADAVPGSGPPPTPEALQYVADTVTSALDPATLRAYWANQTLTMLYWSIRSRNAAAVQAYLDLGESRLD